MPLIRTIGLALFALGFLYPLAATLFRATVEAAPQSQAVPAARHALLLWRTVWLSGLATLLATIAAIPAAYLLGRSVRRRPALVVFATATILLIPPMVSAFGWERLGASWSPYFRCVLVWSLWAWPIPAVILGAGWSRCGHQAYEAALLSTTPGRAFIRIALPSLRRHIALSAIVLFLLFFNDYGVPHACGLLVYPTELLSWASSSPFLRDTLIPATPTILITAIGLVLTMWIAAGMPRDARGDQANPSESSAASWVMSVVFVMLVAAAMLPFAALSLRIGSVSALGEAWRVYGMDIAATMGTAGAAGIVTVVIGITVQSLVRGGGTALAVAVFFGALPGATVGLALIAAYGPAPFRFVYDHWFIVVFAYVARFGWIGILTGQLIGPAKRDALYEQACTDGATPLKILTHIQLPLTATAWISVGAVVAALSVAEVPASTLVRVPGYAPTAHVLIEKFHRFEYDMLFALSVWLMAAALPASVLLAAQRHLGRN